MLACPCPRCGRSAPLSLSEPDALACAACGFAGRPPDDVVRDLHAAAATLGASFDARDRQLGEGQRRALTTAPVRVGAAAGVAASVTGVVAVTVGVALAAIATGAAGAGVVALLGLRERARRRDVAALRFPDARGEPGPARCRVCGSTLATAPAEPVARCHHCAADNLVEPAVDARRDLAKASLEARVARAASLPGRS